VGSAQRPGASPWSARAEATLNQPSSGAASCSWCDRPFQLQQSGGHAQRFCSPHCRLAFHAAARRWALEAIEAGVLSIGDIKRSAEPTRTLLQTMPAPAAMPTCSPAAAADAQFPHKPADGPLASSRAAPIINEIIERIAGGEKATTQIKQQIASAEWAVKRDSAASRPQRNAPGTAAAQRLAREWGGEHEVRTYYGTAAAKIILDRLGPGQLAKFLAFADKVDPAEIINHLRASVAACAAKAARDAVGPRED
jgi:hypothetical protein